MRHLRNFFGGLQIRVLNLLTAGVLGFSFVSGVDAADDWIQKTPSAHPSARDKHAMAYIGGDQALLFGGEDSSSYCADTWVYDLSDNTWTQKSPSSYPSARLLHGMAYIGGDQVLLFGGHTGSGYYDDTWVYDLSANTWTQKAPSPKPTATAWHAMAYIGGDQVLLFGGMTRPDETWVYDLSDNAWTQKAPSPKPTATAWHAMAYIGGDQVLLFGGMKELFSYYADTWMYDLSDDTWTEKSPSSHPLARDKHAMAYIGRHQVLLFGGLVYETEVYRKNHETWVYDLSVNTWTQDSNTTHPSGRYDYGLSETSMDGSSYLVLFGGEDASGVDNETWTFGGGDYMLSYSGPIWYVSSTGSDEIGDGSRGNPFATIQRGIDAAVDGDTVLVADGTYTGDGNRDLDFKGKAITVTSESGAEATIIDCEGTSEDNHRGFHFHSGEMSSSVVDGFTITNGYGPLEPFSGATFSVGGGIYCTHSSPTITNNVITGNAAEYGGGIQCWEYSSPKITSNVIAGNSAISGVGGRGGGGSGVYLYKYCSATVTNNTITRNAAKRTGGGIQINMSSSAEIVNNVIAENRAWRGGGIYCGNSSPMIVNNTITRNHTDDSVDLGLSQNEGGGTYFWYASPILVNTILWGNTANNGNEISHEGSSITITYSDIQDGWPGEGNIDAHPLFVDLDNGDYYLQASSPCIDAGDPSSPLDPDGTRMDMGAFYFDQRDLPPYPPQNLSAIPGNQEITLTWSLNTESDLSHYIIYRSQTQGFTPTARDSVGRVDKPDTTFTDTGLTNGVTYYYRISAVDEAGNKSAYSDEASATPMPAAAAPTITLDLDPTPGDQGVTSLTQVGPDSTIRLFVYAHNVKDLTAYSVEVLFDRETASFVRGGYATVEPLELSIFGRDQNPTEIRLKPTNYSIVAMINLFVPPAFLGPFSVDGDGLLGWIDFKTSSSFGGNQEAVFQVVLTTLTDLKGRIETVKGGKATVRGRGAVVVPQDISVPIGPHDFGEVWLGDSANWTFVVSNTGGDTLSITEIPSNTPEFTASPTRFIVLPYGSQNVTVTFAPLSRGARADTLTILSDDPDEGELAIRFSGVGKTIFADVAQEANVGNTTSKGGIAWGDYDGDGDLDLYTTDARLLQGNILYRNEGDGRFSDATSAAHVGPIGVSIGCVWGDYDNDGDLDLYVTRAGAKNILYRNEGDGIFSDVSERAGVDVNNEGIGAAWVDYDNDGGLDLYTVREPVKLYRNRGDGTFSDVTDAAGVGDIGGKVENGAWGDYDNDGDLDLYVSNREQANTLFRNEGDGKFVDGTLVAGVPGHSSGTTLSAVWGDYDNDGDLDLYVLESNAFRKNLLYRNNGNGTFTDVTERAGVGDNGAGTGAVWGDFDNDGDLDLYVSNGGPLRLGTRFPNVFYRNNGDGTFTDVTFPSGTGDARRSWGATCADYDGDGDLDLYVANDDRDALFRNEGNGNHGLIVETVGTVSNRSGIGARVRVVSGAPSVLTPSAQSLSQIREVRGGSNYASQSSLPVEFGLGTTTRVDSMIVRWPSGIVQVLTDVAVDQVITVTEPSGDMFADPNLEAAIRDTLDKPEGPITDEDLAKLTELDARERGISDLSGIERCVNLQKLVLGDNQIGNIGPLSSLTNLQELDLGGNEISDVSPLSGLTSLQDLYLWANRIGDLSPLSSLTNLEALGLNGNRISDISLLSSLINLQELGLAYNQITDVKPLSTLTYLWHLDLDGNQINDISPLSGLISLQYLYLENNRISDLTPLSRLTNLGELNLSGNRIGDIGPLSGLINL